MENKTKKSSFTVPSAPIVPTVAVPQPQALTLEQALSLANQHQEAGRLPQAEELLRQILNAHPGHPFALHLLGIVAHAAGKTEIAVDLIQQAIRGNGKVALFHSNLGEICRRLERLDEAVKHGKKAVELDPNMFMAQANLGIAYFDQKDYEKAEYCHGLVLKKHPDFAPSLNNMGSILRTRDDYEGAAEYFRKAIAANPKYPDAYNNLGEILTRLDRPTEALEVLDQALRMNPRYEHAHCNRGLAYLAMGDEPKAQTCFVQALRINRDHAPAHAGMVLSFLELHKLTEGEAAARKLIELKPEEADSHSMLGSILLAAGETDEAEKAFKKALALDPAYVPAKSGIGHILMEKGDLKQAEILFQSCMDIEKEQSPTLCSLVQVKKIRPDDPEIALLEKEAEKLKGTMVSSKAIPLNFALGKMYDDLGEYDKGFPYYIEGCRLKRQKLEYDMREKEASNERLKKVFTPEFIAKNKGQGYQSDRPIFVLGMPRSGTTLTEQIIASHPSVYGAGELRDFLKSIDAFLPQYQGLNVDQKIQKAMPRDIAELGRMYAEGLKKYSADAPHVTDKMPGNFHYVGLIHMALPNAKIVHVNRHPLDTCLSCFTRLFAHGQANTYDLHEIGHYYKCYKSLMDHWRKVLPAGSFYDIQYETLVDDTENEARKLIEYCGLEWNDACLEFYNTKRSVRTASVTQVRQPIYKSSKARWKNYEKFLAPLMAGLGDALTPEDRT